MSNNCTNAEGNGATADEEANNNGGEGWADANANAAANANANANSNADLYIGQMNMENLIRQIVQFKAHLGEEVTYKTMNSVYEHQLLKLSMRKSDRTCKRQ